MILVFLAKESCFENHCFYLLLNVGVGHDELGTENTENPIPSTYFSLARILAGCFDFPRTHSSLLLTMAIQLFPYVARFVLTTHVSKYAYACIHT